MTTALRRLFHLQTPNRRLPAPNRRSQPRRGSVVRSAPAPPLTHRLLLELPQSYNQQQNVKEKQSSEHSGN